MLAAVDLDAGLRLHRVGDVGRRDRTEQPAALAGPGLDRDRAAVELGGERLRGLAVAAVAGVAVAAHRVGLLLDSRPIAFSASPRGTRKLRA